MVLMEKWEVVMCNGSEYCDNPDALPHTCPIAEELRGDSETLCTCCPQCERQCGMDV